MVLAQFGWAVAALNGLPGGPRSSFDLFDVEGPTVVAYALSGIALGGLIGAASRRAVTGMFLGLLVFAAIRAFVAVDLRPNYDAPLVAYANTTSGTAAAPPKAWILHQATVDAQDRPMDYRDVDQLMRGFRPSAIAGGPTDMGAYLATLGVRDRFIYQPAERYAKFDGRRQLLAMAERASELLATVPADGGAPGQRPGGAEGTSARDVGAAA